MTKKEKDMLQFITGGFDRPCYFRKEIEIEKQVKKAMAKVCGLGQFVFHINGKKAGDHELDPGWSDYRKYIQYVVFDVTDLLDTGRNALGAEVGNGWFIKDDTHYTFSFPAFMPPNPNPYLPFGKSLIFALELTITYTDGETEVFTSDETWKSKEHYITMSNVYGSETFDGSRRQEGFSKAGFDDSKWKYVQKVEETELPATEFTRQFEPPVKVIKSYEGRFTKCIPAREVTISLPMKEPVIEKRPKRDVYDFGQNMSGILTITAKGKKGDVIKIYPAEKTDKTGDADQTAKGWTVVDTVITCILGEDDKEETFRQTFTYFAGKVAAIEKSDPRVEILSIAGEAITSAWKADGSFHCDDERYQKIYDMIERTVEANMLSVHTDCPTIERFAWQEPNHLMASSILFMKDGKKLWKKFLLDMRKGQHTKEDVFHDFEGNAFPAGDGLVPSQAPCYIPNVLPVPGMGSFYDIIPWGSSLILGARWHYRFYGDISVIEENYDAGMRYLSYLKTRVNEEGFLNHGLGDWGNPENELARENVETAFLYADTTALMEFADILGKDQDAEALSQYAEKIKKNYNEKLLITLPDGKKAYRSFEHGDENVLTQACEAIPLYFGLVPPDAREDVAEVLRRTLTEKGSFCAGEVGLPYIIQMAKEFGMNDLIASFVTKDEHPGYYAFVKSGMTTLGEYWEENPRSHCHDMMGHIIEWYYNGIAGIEALTPGFSSIKVRPYLPERMHRFSCTYESESGKICVEVKEENGIIHLDVSTAPGIQCEIDTSYLEKRGEVKKKLL